MPDESDEKDSFAFVIYLYLLYFRIFNDQKYSFPDVLLQNYFASPSLLTIIHLHTLFRHCLNKL